MFGTTLDNGIFLFCAFWLVLIILLWGREAFRIKNFQWHLTNRKLFHCDSCHLSFLTKDPATITRCPRCNTICIRRKTR